MVDTLKVPFHEGKQLVLDLSDILLIILGIQIFLMNVSFFMFTQIATFLCSIDMAMKRHYEMPNLVEKKIIYIFFYLY